MLRFNLNHIETSPAVQGRKPATACQPNQERHIGADGDPPRRDNPVSSLSWAWRGPDKGPAASSFAFPAAQAWYDIAAASGGVCHGILVPGSRGRPRPAP